MKVWKFSTTKQHLRIWKFKNLEIWKSESSRQSYIKDLTHVRIIISSKLNKLPTHLNPLPKGYVTSTKAANDHNQVSNCNHFINFYTFIKPIPEEDHNFQYQYIIKILILTFYNAHTHCQRANVWPLQEYSTAHRITYYTEIVHFISNYFPLSQSELYRDSSTKDPRHLSFFSVTIRHSEG